MSASAAAGERFYGKIDMEEEIVELLDAGKVEENLERITDAPWKEAVSNCLKLYPEERWTTAEALVHEVFSMGGTGGSTTQSTDQ